MSSQDVRYSNARALLLIELFNVLDFNRYFVSKRACHVL